MPSLHIDRDSRGVPTSVTIAAGASALDAVREAWPLALEAGYRAAFATLRHELATTRSVNRHILIRNEAGTLVEVREGVDRLPSADR